jgi:hypothetical protein
MEAFLKHKEPFVEQCMDLKQKSNFVVDNVESLQAFVNILEEIKAREKLL